MVAVPRMGGIRGRRVSVDGKRRDLEGVFRGVRAEWFGSVSLSRPKSAGSASTVRSVEWYLSSREGIMVESSVDITVSNVVLVSRRAFKVRSVHRVRFCFKCAG